MDDKVYRKNAPWNAVVFGTEENNGWLEVSGQYLPMYVHGVPVITEYSQDDDIDISPASPYSNRGSVGYNRGSVGFPSPGKRNSTSFLKSMDKRGSRSNAADNTNRPSKTVKFAPTAGL